MSLNKDVLYDSYSLCIRFVIIIADVSDILLGITNAAPTNTFSSEFIITSQVDFFLVSVY